MSSDGIVVVSDNSVTALAAGEVILTATTTDGSHTATCAVTVAAAPQEYDITLEASQVMATYYGTQFSNSGEENYYVILSDLGFDADGYALANGHYYIIDLFSDAAPNDLNNITIPEGTYTIGGYAETTAGTFTSDYSRYQDTSETSGYRAYFTDGTVTVSYSGSNLVVDAVFVDELGSTHHVTYNGPCDVLDDTPRAICSCRISQTSRNTAKRCSADRYTHTNTQTLIYKENCRTSCALGLRS